MLPSPDARTEAGTPTRVARRWPLTVLRTSTCVLLLLTLAQPVLAGMFITGDTDLLDLHALNATLVSVMSWLTVAAAVTLWRPGGGPAWPIGLTLLIAGLVEAQSGFGYARQLYLHIPLGVALVAGLTAQTYWVFAHRPTALVNAAPSPAEIHRKGPDSRTENGSR